MAALSTVSRVHGVCSESGKLIFNIEKPLFEVFSVVARCHIFLYSNVYSSTLGHLLHEYTYSRITASRVDDNGDNDVSVTNRASLFFLSSLLRVETRISPPMEMIQENFEQFQRLAPFVSDNFALIHLEHSRHTN